MPRPSFCLRDLSIPAAEIRGGGPPQDGIPAIIRPQSVAAANARFLKANDRVVGVALTGQARAYPISILTQHEIVNDKLGDTPIAVTYCPLCDSIFVFDRTTDIGLKEFGVSGLLYTAWAHVPSRTLRHRVRRKPESDLEAIVLNNWDQSDVFLLRLVAFRRDLRGLPISCYTVAVDAFPDCALTRGRCIEIGWDLWGAGFDSVVKARTKHWR